MDDPYVWIIGAADRALMSFYRHARDNARRIVRIVIAFIPLIMLLVGSCKTSEMPGAYGSNAGAEQFRIALFPDRVNFEGSDYKPAAGYVSRAQTYIEGDPAALMRLTEAEVGYLFGQPTQKRRDADAQIWQYKTEACVVDFYFYGQDDGRPVSYIDYRPAGGKPAPQAKCLEKMITTGNAA